MRRTILWLAVVWFAVLVWALLTVTPVRAGGLMGSVGSMMSPTNGAGSTPGGGFALVTEANDPLATEASSIIVTEDAP